ncbi:MAG: hypothetical protein LBS00_11600 [Synergistaceae bacterium]|nr:hypothetical protein [Synergistaceae bacterium]
MSLQEKMKESVCPECGAVLNEQPGFDTNVSTWACMKCGQVLVAEDKGVVEDRDEYFCTKCGAVLNEQPGFNPYTYYGTWTCTECGQFLFDEDVDKGDSFSGVAWYCDNCGTLLNKQPGFSDSYGSWICAACSFRNSITEDDIRKS